MALKDMDNPYDKGARDELQKQTGESYLFDVAYYEGHYYVYFGVLPVLLFYLPFYLFTGSSFPTAIGVLIACIMFVLGVTALMDRFARHHFKRVSLGLFLLLQMPRPSQLEANRTLETSLDTTCPNRPPKAFAARGIDLS